MSFMNPQHISNSWRGQVLTLILSADTYNVNLFDLASAQPNFIPGLPAFVRVIVEDTVTIGSTSTATKALRTGVFTEGTLIHLVIDGLVEGKGGLGGKGSHSENGGGTGGADGGDALHIETPTILDFTGGMIWGGGGGGGGGRHNRVYMGAGGGGGGAGSQPGAGGDRGSDINFGNYGDPGTATAGGLGGALHTAGGKGGDPGEPGAPGATYATASPAYPGGAAGYAITATAAVSIIGYGDLRGIASFAAFPTSAIVADEAPDALTVTFYKDISSSDFTAGVSITIDDVAVTGLASSSAGMTDTVIFTFNETVEVGQEVRWTYDANIGDWTDEDSFTIPSITASLATNNVEGPEIVLPVITAQPSNQIVTEGDDATFTITATGATSYQWRIDEDPVSGATSASFTIEDTTLAMDGYEVDCVVTNDDGSVTSNVAMLTVSEVELYPPVITVQPTNQSVTEGEDATYTITATGADSYQWRIEGVPVPGATTSTLTLEDVALGDNGAEIDCVVSNEDGDTVSDTVTLTVTEAIDPPVITGQPSNQTVTEPAAAEFEITATGADSYQWYMDAGLMEGQTSATLNTGPTVAADSGTEFYCIVTNAGGSVQSDTVTLTVNAGSFSVAGQVFSFGADTRAGAGSVSFEASAGEIASIGTVTGTNAADWTVSFSGGNVTITPASNAPTNGPYSLTVPCYSGAGQTGALVNAPVTINMVADTYHIRESGGSTTQFNAARSAGLAGKTVILRTGSVAGDLVLSGVTLTGDTYILGEDENDKPSIRSQSVQNIGPAGRVRFRNLHIIDVSDTVAQLGYYSGTGHTYDVQFCDFEGGFAAGRPETDFYYFVTYSGATATPQVGDSITGGTSGGETNIMAVDDSGGSGTLWLDGGTRGGLPLTPEDLINGETISEDGAAWSATLTADADYLEIGGRVNGISTSSTGTLFENVIISNNTFRNMGRPAHIVARGGQAIFDNNVMENTFGDLGQINACGTSGYENNPPSYTSIQNNISDGHPTNPNMVGNPHPDGFQMMGFYLPTANWENIYFLNNQVVVADPAGNNISLFFISNFSGSGGIKGFWCNNFGPLRSLPHGIDLGSIAYDSYICNNTIVNDNYSEAILQAAIVASGSGNVVRNNVVNIMTATGVAEDENNVVLGSYGGTVSYESAFVGPTFGNATSLADALSKFTPKPGGPLLAGASYVLGDVGCIDSDSNHVAWDPASIGEGADETAPVFASASPADDAAGVAVDAAITITFAEANTLSLGTSKNFYLYDVTNSTMFETFSTSNTGTSPGDVNLVGNTVTLYPTTDLDNEVEYSCRWDAGAVKDDSDNEVAARSDDSLSFTTAAASPAGITDTFVRGAYGTLHESATSDGDGTWAVSGGTIVTQSPGEIICELDDYVRAGLTAEMPSENVAISAAIVPGGPETELALRLRQPTENDDNNHFIGGYHFAAGVHRLFLGSFIGGSYTELGSDVALPGAPPAGSIITLSANGENISIGWDQGSENISATSSALPEGKYVSLTMYVETGTIPKITNFEVVNL